MDAQTHDPIAARAQIVGDLNERIAQLEAVQDSRDFILGWENHLAVKWVDGKVVICGVDIADVIGTDATPEEAWAFVPNVRNGRNEAAKLMRRGEAAKRDIAQCRALIAHFG